MSDSTGAPAQAVALSPQANADAGGLVVDEGAAATVGGQDPAQDQVLVPGVGQALVVEIGPGGVTGRQGEQGGDLGLRRAPADKARFTAGSRGEAQGVEDNGLAGARLTRQHAEAGGKFQFNGIDNDKIANGQCMEHGFCGWAAHRRLRWRKS